MKIYMSYVIYIHMKIQCIMKYVCMLYEAESFRNELAKLVPTWANFAVSDSA